MLFIVTGLLHAFSKKIEQCFIFKFSKISIFRIVQSDFNNVMQMSLV